jgi:hypothetical protein
LLEIKMGFKLGNAAHYAASLGLKTRIGAVILRVRKNGPADRFGLKRGDVIIQAGRCLVKGLEHMNYIAARYRTVGRLYIKCHRVPVSFKAPIKPWWSQNRPKQLQFSAMHGTFRPPSGVQLLWRAQVGGEPYPQVDPHDLILKEDDRRLDPEITDDSIPKSPTTRSRNHRFFAAADRHGAHHLAARRHVGQLGRPAATFTDAPTTPSTASSKPGSSRDFCFSPLDWGPRPTPSVSRKSAKPNIFCFGI